MQYPVLWKGYLSKFDFGVDKLESKWSDTTWRYRLTARWIITRKTPLRSIQPNWTSPSNWMVNEKSDWPKYRSRWASKTSWKKCYFTIQNPEVDENDSLKFTLPAGHYSKFEELSAGLHIAKMQSMSLTLSIVGHRGYGLRLRLNFFCFALLCCPTFRLRCFPSIATTAE